MTDNEIINALNGNISNAKRCDCKVWSIEVYKLENVLDLINRLKAEIEELKDILEKVPTNAYDLQVEASEKLENQIKSEAIKEFAEELKHFIIPQKADGYTREIVLKRNIDNLVKEMTEVNEKL